MGKYLLHTLMLLQKKAIRIIAKASYLDHIQPLYVQCKDFLTTVKLKTLLPTKCFFFITIQEIHSYGTGSSKKENFIVKLCKTKRKLISISIMGVKLWKQLDVNVCNLKTIIIFTQIIKNMFLYMTDTDAEVCL